MGRAEKNMTSRTMDNVTRLPRCEWRIKEAPFKLLLVAAHTDARGALRWLLMTPKQFIHLWGQA